MFDDLKAKFDQMRAARGDDPSRGDAMRADAPALYEALVEAKAALQPLRDGIGATERELATERKALEDTTRRGGMAAEIGDAETAQIAEQFAQRHRERVAVLERKLGVQVEELQLATRDVEELTAKLRAARGPGAAANASAQAAWRDLEAAGGTRPETDAAGDLLKSQVDHAAREAAAEAQLAYLKKKMGKG